MAVRFAATNFPRVSKTGRACKGSLAFLPAARAGMALFPCGARLKAPPPRQPAGCVRPQSSTEWIRQVDPRRRRIVSRGSVGAVWRGPVAVLGGLGGRGLPTPFHLTDGFRLSSGNLRAGETRAHLQSMGSVACSRKRGFDCKVAVARCGGLPTWRALGRSGWRCALQGKAGQRRESESSHGLDPGSFVRPDRSRWAGGQASKQASKQASRQAVG